MNAWYIGIGPKKAIVVDPYYCCGAIPCQFSGNGQVTRTPIFLKFYSNFKKITAMIIPCDDHLQIWMFVKKSYDYKAF